MFGTSVQQICTRCALSCLLAICSFAPAAAKPAAASTSALASARVPAFSGQVVDGSIYGRGAQDMKNEGLAQMVVRVMLKREKAALDRDVIFLAVSDEEADGTGSDWMIKNQSALLANAEFRINEGG